MKEPVGFETIIGHKIERYCHHTAIKKNGDIYQHFQQRNDEMMCNSRGRLQVLPLSMRRRWLIQLFGFLVGCCRMSRGMMCT